MARTYKAILFHPEGDCVTDFHGRKTIKEVWAEIEEMGSRWIFYPIVFVASDSKPFKLTTIVDAPEGLEYFKRRKANTVRRYLEKEWENRKDEICKRVNAGEPWDFVYPDLPYTISN